MFLKIYEPCKYYMNYFNYLMKTVVSYQSGTKDEQISAKEIKSRDKQLY